MTIVPSKTNHATAHPLESAIMLGEPLREEYVRLLEPADISKISRAKSSDDAYRATDGAAGRRVLLVDDTFTSGATFQSAASALALGGAKVVAGLVIGRVIDTDNANYPTRSCGRSRRSIRPRRCSAARASRAGALRHATLPRDR